MMNQWSALAVSFGFVFFIVGMTTVLTKLFHFSGPVSRKMIHIGVGNWILLAVILFHSLPFLLITPITFIVLNFLSYRFNIVKVMEQEDTSLGTVWYAVTLTLLSAAGFLLHNEEIAVIGILTMGYGDGLAGAIGKRFGKHKWFEPYSSKSMEGSLTMFGVTFLVSFLGLGYWNENWNPLISIFVALTATIAELISKNGRDNLTVPILTASAVFFTETMMFSLEFFLLILLAFTVLLYGYFKDAITFEGMWHGLFVGLFLSYFGELNVLVALILFFVIGSLVSSVGKNKKKEGSHLHERTGARSIIQVYANAGGAMIMVILYAWTKNQIFNIAAIITFVAALADTVSSEIGMLSKRDPISILTLKKMQPGLSGGISILGIVSGFLASLFISYCILRNPFSDIVLVTLLGFLGSITDSVLGAAVQGKYYVKTENIITEKPMWNQEVLVLASGIRQINNDVVNFLSTFLVSWIYIGIKYFI